MITTLRRGLRIATLQVLAIHSAVSSGAFSCRKATAGQEAWWIAQDVRAHFVVSQAVCSGHRLFAETRQSGRLAAWCHTPITLRRASSRGIPSRNAQIISFRFRSGGWCDGIWDPWQDQATQSLAARGSSVLATARHAHPTALLRPRRGALWTTVQSSEEIINTRHNDPTFAGQAPAHDDEPCHEKSVRQN